ncbi:MAG: hypothetical protein FVQ79_04790 [Planctomycetes bacterium]|nr:hypothetical protein [Planctomycetota bacterium]
MISPIIKRMCHLSKKILPRLKVVILLLLLLWGIYELVGNKILKPLTRRQIEHLTGAQVTIGDIKFQLDGLVVMKDLQIGTCLDESEAGTIIQADKVEAVFSRTSFLKLNPRLKSLTVKDFTINVQYDTEQKSWNFSALQIGSSAKAKNPLPALHLDRGSINLYTKTQNDSKEICKIPVFVGFIAQVGKNNTYGFSVQTHEENGPGYCRIGGKWIRGKQSSVTLTSEQLSSFAFPVLGNAWDMTDVVMNIDYDEDTIRIKKLTSKVGQDADILINGTVKNYRRNPEYEVEASLRNMVLSADPRPNALIYNSGALEKLGPKLRAFLQLYQPDGLGDLSFKAAGSFDDIHGSKWSANVTCRDISILYTRFPYPLNNMTGKLRLDETDIFLDNLECKHGDVDLQINGHSKSTDKGIGFDMTVTSDNMSLDKGLYKAMNSDQQFIWSTFTPSGIAKINYRMWREPGEKKDTYLTVDFVDAKAIYQHFPYLLDNLKGNITVEPGTFTINHLSSTRQNSRIEVNGEVTKTNTERPQFDIKIEANDIPLDSELMDALPSRQRRFYEQFSLDVTTDVSIKVFSNQVGKRLVDYIADVNIVDASLTYEKFPLPLTDVTVDAVLTPDVTILRKIVGYNGNSEIQVSGKVWPDTDANPETAFCLSIQAKQLELKKNWLDALPPQALKIVSDLRPTGTIDAHANISVNPREEFPANEIVIDCKSVDMSPKAFAFPLKNVTGEVTITKENILLKNIRSQNKIASDPNKIESIALNGTIARNSNNTYSGDLTAKATNLFFDKRFKNAMGADSLLSYDNFTPQGYVDFDIEKLKFYTDSSDSKWVDIIGNIALRKFASANAGAVKDLDAVLSAKALYKIGHGLMQGSGNLQAEHFTLLDRSINDIKADIIYDPVGGTISSNEFLADTYGGRVIGDCRLTLLPGQGIAYKLKTSFCDVDLNGIVSANQSDESEQNDYSQGIVSGSLGISGILGKTDSTIGRISIGIKDMAFARRSLFGKIVTTVQLDNPTDFIFNEITAESYLKGSMIDLEKVQMFGPSTVLLGSGKINMQNRQIDLVLTAYGGKKTLKPSFLETLASVIGSAVMQVEVKGNLEDPTIAETTLPVIKKPFEIFGTR